MISLPRRDLHTFVRNPGGRNSVLIFVRCIPLKQDSDIATIKQSQKRKKQERKSSDAKRNRLLNSRKFFMHLLQRIVHKSLKLPNPNQVALLHHVYSSCLIVVTISTQSEQRQISKSSTFSENSDSAGGGVVPYSKETSTRNMAHQFMSRVMEIWNASATLEKLPSKRELALQWAGYAPHSTFLVPCFLAPSFTLLVFTSPLRVCFIVLCSTCRYIYYHCCRVTLELCLGNCV